MRFRNTYSREKRRVTVSLKNEVICTEGSTSLQKYRTSHNMITSRMSGHYFWRWRGMGESKAEYWNWFINHRDYRYKGDSSSKELSVNFSQWSHFSNKTLCIENTNPNDTTYRKQLCCPNIGRQDVTTYGDVPAIQDSIRRSCLASKSKFRILNLSHLMLGKAWA